MDIKAHVEQALAAVGELKTLINGVEGEVTAQPDLSGLTKEGSTKLPVWRRWVYVFSFLSWLQLRSLERLKKDVQEIESRSYIGTAPWYSVQAKRFQYGDALQLEIQPTYARYYYPVIDESKQVVKHAALNNGLMKVAGEDGNGKRVSLTLDQVNGLNTYLGRIGVFTAIPKAVSYPADLMTVSMDIYFNALLNVEKVKQGVETAISDYIKNLDFDGVFFVSRLQDVVQSVEGVKDVYLKQIQGRHSQSSYRTIERTYAPVSGYLEIDAEQPLSTTITYIPA